MNLPKHRNHTRSHSGLFTDLTGLRGEVLDPPKGILTLNKIHLRNKNPLIKYSILTTDLTGLRGELLDPPKHILILSEYF